MFAADRGFGEVFCCGYFFPLLMHTSHYPKVTTAVIRAARAAALQIPFCGFCLPGHPDASFVTALETSGHELSLMHAPAPRNADPQLPSKSNLPHTLLSFLFFFFLCPQQVSFHEKLESHVGKSLSLSLHAGGDV